LIISSLKDQKEFDLVSKQGKKLHTAYFILILAKNFTSIVLSSANTLFFGMKVSRKLGKAVIRNKIKRRIRHLVRLISKVPQFEHYSWGMTIIPKKGFEKVKFAILLSELEKILRES
jgi:ribonuclease P protein component